MKKRKNNTLYIVLLFIVGFAILLYPTFSNWWNERRNASLMRSYETKIAEVDKSDLEHELLHAQAYNRTLIGNVLPDAFATEEANHPNTDYEEILNLNGDGIMATIEIPSIHVKLPVYHYTTEEVLEKGAGHLPGSSLPVGGTSTHSVISAHRGLPSAKLFTDLDRVKEKDLFYLHVLGETLAYEVDLIKVIEPTDTSDLGIVEGKDYSTLFTCTPYAVNSHRLLVRGHRVPYVEEQYLEEVSKIAIPKASSVLIRILCVVLGVVLAFVMLLVLRMLQRKKKKKVIVPPVKKEEDKEKEVPHE